MISVPASAWPLDPGLGLETGEFILRGGRLEKPLLLTGRDLEAKNGLQFCKLDLLNPFLALFLSGLPFSKHPLAHSQLRPMLSRLRDEKIRELLGCPAAEAQDDEADTLALNTPSPVASPRLTLHKRSSQSARQTLKKRAVLARHAFVVVEFEVGDQKFPLRLMVDIASANPSFEVSSVNFQRLFDWFELETPERLQRALEAASAPKPERVARSNQVYYRKDRQEFFRKSARDKGAGLIAASAFETPRKRKRGKTRFTTRVVDRKTLGRPRKTPAESEEEGSTGSSPGSPGSLGSRSSAEKTEGPEF